MSRRVDNITVSSPAGSSQAPAVREVVRIVSSAMPDATAFNRGDEWTQSDEGSPVDWHVYVHNGITWVEKYVNPEGKISPVGISNQTKAVNSPTDPVPDYIGQPGIDANGNSYISISLSGTMWKVLDKAASFTNMGPMSANDKVLLDRISQFCILFTAGYIKYTEVTIPAVLNIKLSFIMTDAVNTAELLEGQNIFVDIRTTSGKKYLYSKVGSTYIYDYQELELNKRYDVSIYMDDTAKTVKIYVNKVLVKDISYTGSIIPTTYFNIGGDPLDVNWYLKGYLWDVRLNGQLFEDLYQTTKTSSGTFTAKSNGELSDFLRLLQTLRNCNFKYVAISRDLNGLISSSSVLWEDGSDGTITFGDYNAAAIAYDSFSVTHVNSGLKAVQGKVTRDADYLITDKPKISIATI
jgi:hypothetical protein